MHDLFPRLDHHLLALLTARRSAHLSYLASTERVVVAGPLFSLDDEDGDPVSPFDLWSIVAGDA
jgi:hypothetical protein